MIDWTKPIELSDGTPAIADLGYYGTDSNIVSVTFDGYPRDATRAGKPLVPNDDASFPVRWNGRHVRNVAPKVEEFYVVLTHKMDNERFQATLEGAEAIAEKLAREVPGQKNYILKVVAEAVTAPATVTITRA